MSTVESFAPSEPSIAAVNDVDSRPRRLADRSAAVIGGSTDLARLAHLVAVQPDCIGRFTAEPDSGRWAWTGIVDRFFGYPTDEVEHSWEFLLSHIAPSERELVDGAYQLACSRTGPFGWAHHVNAADGVVRSILVIGETSARAIDNHNDPGIGPGLDGAGRLLRGYLIDVTLLRAKDAQAAADEAVRRSAEHRAVIEQAKGALMLAYGLSPDAAFDLLTWHSQHANRKLYLIAGDVVDGLHRRGVGDHRLRMMMDKLLADTWPATG